jgi:hypothetical protein
MIFTVAPIFKKRQASAASTPHGIRRRNQWFELNELTLAERQREPASPRQTQHSANGDLVIAGVVGRLQMAFNPCRGAGQERRT